MRPLVTLYCTHRCPTLKHYFQVFVAQVFSNIAFFLSVALYVLRFRKLRLLIVFLVMSFQTTFCEVAMHRYLILLTSKQASSWMRYCFKIRVFLLLTLSLLRFKKLEVIYQSFSYRSSLCRSVCKMSASLSVFKNR